MDNQLTSKQLLESFRLHDLTLSNRVVMAPLTRSRAGVNRIPNALMAEYYSQRASAGLIVTEATTISRRQMAGTNHRAFTRMKWSMVGN